MRPLLMLLVLLVFGCTQKSKEIIKKNEVIDSVVSPDVNDDITTVGLIPPVEENVQSRVEDEQEILNDVRETEEEVSFSFELTKNEINLHNESKVQLITNQPDNVSFSLGSEDFGRLVTNPDGLIGTFFISNNVAGSVKIFATYNNMTLVQTLRVIGKLSVSDFEVVAEKGENNYVKIPVTGDIDSKNINFEVELGQIENGFYIPPEENLVIEILNQINSNPKSTYQRFISTPLVSQSGNLNSVSEIKIYPKMHFDVFRKDNKLQSFNIVCNGNSQYNHLVLKIYGGLEPYKVDSVNELQVTPKDSNTYQIAPSNNCGQKEVILSIFDKNLNKRSLKVSILKKLSATISDQTLLVSGGAFPYRLINGSNTYNSQGSFNIATIGQGIYKVFDSIGNSLTLQYSEEENVTFEISPFELIATNPFSFISVTPGSFKINLAATGTNQALNYFSGQNFNTYSSNDTYNKKSMYFPIASKRTLNNNEYSFNISRGNFSTNKNRFIQNKPIRFKYNEDYFDVTTLSRINTFNTESFPEYAQGFATQFLYFVNQYRSHDLGEIYLGQEHFNSLSLEGGKNGHNVTFSNKFVFHGVKKVLTREITHSGVRIIQREVDEHQTYSLGPNVCSDNNNLYGNWAYSSSNLDTRGEDPYVFNFSFDGLIENTYTIGKFNKLLRKLNIDNIQDPSIFNIEHRVSDLTGSQNEVPGFTQNQIANLKDEYYSDSTKLELKLGSAFETTARTITLPSNSTNITYLGDNNYNNNIYSVYSFENNNKVCFKFTNNYRSQYKSLVELNTIALPASVNLNGFSYDDSLKAMCDYGKNLTDSFFVDGAELKKINVNPLSKTSIYRKKWRRGANYLPVQFDDYNVLSGDMEIIRVFNSFNSSSLSSLNTVVLSTNETTNEITCGNNLSYFKLDGSEIVKENILNYSPDNVLLKRQGCAHTFDNRCEVSDNDDYIYIPAIKRNNCDPFKKVFLKVNLAIGSVDEFDYISILNSQRILKNQLTDYSISDIELLSEGDDKFLMISGVVSQNIYQSNLFQQTYRKQSPFVAKINYTNNSLEWVKVYSSTNCSGNNRSISNVNFIKTIKNEQLFTSLMFEINGKYYKGGSLFPARSSSGKKDIGRLEFDSDSGKVVYFRRYEDLSSNNHSYNLEIANTTSYDNVNTSLISREGSNGRLFFEIGYYFFRR